MIGNKTLATILYYTSILGASLISLLILYFLGIAFLAGIDKMPKSREASIEIPVRLHKLNENYPVTAAKGNLDKLRIEVNKATIEAVPQDYPWWQFIFHIHAAIWVAFFLFVLIQIIQILENFKKGNPFPHKNALRFRRIAWAVIAFPFYNYLIRWSFDVGFADALKVTDATIIEYGLFDFDFFTLFIGIMLLLLVEAFKSGAVLQEYENQTV